MMKSILNRLVTKETLSFSESKQLMLCIGEGKYNNSQIASLLTILQMRPVTPDELGGFRDALIELSCGTDLSEYKPIDLCGTGGDEKNTINISTLSAFVVAGAGVRVTKHGNYGMSSVSGSSNVLEELKIPFTNNPDHLRLFLEQAGICYLHGNLTAFK